MYCYCRELQPNNQLKLLRGGDFCLSQMGSKAGSSDVASKGEATVSHNRPDDKDHGPSAAMDGNSETFWASQEFESGGVPAAVDFTLDFGDKYKLTSAVIDWEYPALAYTIAASEDGSTFTDVAHNAANSLYNTIDDLKSVVARAIRVRMERAHPVYG